MDTTTQSSGIGFAGLLTVLFIGLKLTGYIAWSWWWVLSPLWIGFAIFLGVAVIVLIIFLLAMLGIAATKTKVKPTIKQSKLQERLKNMRNV